MTQLVTDFAELHGLKLRVNKRPNCPVPQLRYYAQFDDTRVVHGGLSCSAYGDGATPQAAIKSFAKNISGKMLAINPDHISRREVQVPELTTLKPTKRFEVRIVETLIDGVLEYTVKITNTKLKNGSYNFDGTMEPFKSKYRNEAELEAETWAEFLGVEVTK